MQRHFITLTESCWVFCFFLLIVPLKHHKAVKLQDLFCQEKQHVLLHPCVLLTSIKCCLCALRAERAWHATTWPTAGQGSSWWWRTATLSTTSMSPVTALTASMWCPLVEAWRPLTAYRLYTGTHIQVQKMELSWFSFRHCHHEFRIKQTRYDQSVDSQHVRLAEELQTL